MRQINELLENLIPKRFHTDLIYIREHFKTLGLKDSGRLCPVCQKEFPTFGGKTSAHPVVAKNITSLGERSDVFCYVCGAKERHRLLALYLERMELLSRPDTTNILYFAPVSGVESRLQKYPSVNITTADLSLAGVDVFTDITSLPFGSDSYDLIICSHVLEHIPDDREAIKELRRVVKPDGKVLAMVPIDHLRTTTLEDKTASTTEDRKSIYGHPQHQRIYGTDFSDRLCDLGFSVNKFTVQSEFSQVEVRKYGLIPRETIYICEPRPNDNLI